jgi:hypothetical protein
MVSFKSILYHTVLIAAIVVAYRVTLAIHGRAEKQVGNDIQHGIKMMAGPLLNKDGKIKMSGYAMSPIREADPELFKPGMFHYKPFLYMTYKRGMIHSVISKNHMFVLEMTDRNYLAQFNAYYYNFETKKVLSHREIFFYGQYPKWGDEFTHFKGTWELKSSSGFSIKIRDSESSNDSITRHLETQIPAWDFKGDFKISKSKGQEGGFHTMPLYEDKRYWLKNYAQMNLAVDGHFSIGQEKTLVNSETKPWSACFNDWSGIFAHKSYFRSTWIQFDKLQRRDGTTPHQKMAFFGNMGLIKSSQSRNEVDTVFMDNTSAQMEPTLLWPNTDDFMDEWRIETHTEMRYQTHKITGFFRPEAIYERGWDIGVLREEERIVFGTYDIQQIVAEEGNIYYNVPGYGFSWDFYTHW